MTKQGKNLRTVALVAAPAAIFPATSACGSSSNPNSPSNPNAPVIASGSAQAGVIFLGAIGGPSLTVQNGSLLTSGSAIIGNSTNGFTPGTSELQSGTATINGVGTQWTAEAFSVGFYGTGTLNVTAHVPVLTRRYTSERCGPWMMSPPTRVRSASSFPEPLK